ncbi:hypothetical protein [Faecalibacter macacae]|uniref:TonB C-terminal domain-containing protein n=1 Tax=Faecalibacter macacae TaxID=1859289 RepID=A0A3L9MG12_9FLAO|nr:hypothetical protein [Faecalibacter macacae]RLZ11838.1 hypothetical protein EAH69_02650 [Faecalibacter macacae]
MKNFLPLLILLCSLNINAQENFKFPTYPGCQKQKTNDELKKCFYERLSDEIRSEFYEQDHFWIENNNINQTTLVFTVTKNGDLANFSYTKDSNPEAAKFFLKHIYRVKKHYESRGKKFIPAKNDGKPIDFQIHYQFRYHQSK